MPTGDFDVLLIDDDSNLHLIYDRLLKEAFADGVSFEACGDESGLKNLLKSRTQPDVIILDQKLDNGTRGMDLVSEIRRSWPRSFIVMNSAYGSEDLAVEAIRHGVDDYVEGRKQDSGALISAITRGIERQQCRLMTFSSVEAIPSVGNRVCKTRFEETKARIEASLSGG